MDRLDEYLMDDYVRITKAELLALIDKEVAKELEEFLRLYPDNHLHCALDWSPRSHSNICRERKKMRKIITNRLTQLKENQ